jgi:peptidoglycan/LPS O-acetylase OafA/YrhL
MDDKESYVQPVQNEPADTQLENAVNPARPPKVLNGPNLPAQVNNNKTDISAASDLPNLDALRALAVLLVLGAHTWEVLQYLGVTAMNPAVLYVGRLGVLLFFVHTAFVLMASLDRCDGAFQFYVRRAFRIYPLAIACVLLVLALRVPAMPMLEWVAPSAGAILSNLALTQTLTQSASVITPLWSLPIELQMYAVLPLIFFLSKDATNVRWLGGLWLVSVLGAFLIYPISRRLQLFLFAPCFIAGIIAYALTKRAQPILGARWWLPALASIIALYAGIEEVTEGLHHRALQALICLAVGLAIPRFRQSTWQGLNRVAHLIARYSFGIYLFHVPALWVGFYALKLPVAWGAVVAVTTLAALSIGGYHLIERPMMRVGSRVGARVARPERGNGLGSPLKR